MTNHSAENHWTLSDKPLIPLPGINVDVDPDQHFLFDATLLTLYFNRWKRIYMVINQRRKDPEIANISIFSMRIYMQVILMLQN